MILCMCLCGLYVLCVVYVYVLVVMCTSVRVCAKACGGWWLTWSVLHILFLRQVFLIEHGTH